MIYFAHYHSPLGMMTAAHDEIGITALSFATVLKEGSKKQQNANNFVTTGEFVSSTPLFDTLFASLDAYFSGQLMRFDLPLHLIGTSFQMRVWQALQEIPYGKQVSYAALAAHIGAPRSARAVGMANHANPIAIVVPCHRVIHSDGSLGGYAGGIAIKKALLEIEQRNCKN